MEGYAVTRATSHDGDWAYTLYGREGGGEAFVHSLATEYRFALCIDLPWSASRATMLKLKMSVAPNGDLTIRDRKGKIAVIDGVNTLTISPCRPSCRNLANALELARDKGIAPEYRKP